MRSIRIIWLRMPDRKEKQDESHTFNFENHVPACDGCSGSNKTVCGVPIWNISSYLPGNCRDFLLTALLSYGFGLENSGECLKMVLAGFLFYLLPCTVEIVIAGIVFLEEWIRSFT